MRLLFFGLIVFFVGPFSIAQSLDTVYAVQADFSDYRFETNIESYKSSENWTIWSFPMDNILDTTEHVDLQTMNYSHQVINDQNLSTSWLTDTINNEFPPKIVFEFNHPDFTIYGAAYQFFGEINLFNGMCKSLEDWNDYSRIKLIKITYNDRDVCFVQLLDVWHFQYFSIENYFQNKYSQKYLDAPFEIQEGDKLSFEVVELYEGMKYSTGAISEFMIEGAKN